MIHIGPPAVIGTLQGKRNSVKYAVTKAKKAIRIQLQIQVSTSNLLELQLL